MGFLVYAMLLLSQHAADALCSETRDPVGCIAKGCAWCAAADQRGCSRSIGKCPKHCSTTKKLADLSSCPNMPVTRTAATDADPTVNAAGPDTSAVGVGVGFSGGGSRAFACTFGWVRGLRDLGLWRSDNLTVAGISGAAWFLAPFAYASADEAALLGEYLEPERLSSKNIAASGGSMAALPGPIIAKCTARLLGVLGTLDSEGLGRIWRDVIDATFLKPLSAVWKSNFGCPTPSTRRCPRGRVCSMAWSFQAVDAPVSP